MMGRGAVREDEPEAPGSRQPERGTGPAPPSGPVLAREAGRDDPVA
jgi:hypothetical protein